MATAATKGQTTVDPYSEDGWTKAPQETLIKFDTIGDQLIGQILSFSKTDNGVPQIHFNSPEYGKCFVNAGKDLERQVKAIGAREGWYLKITLTAQQEVAGRETKLNLYDVEYKKP